MTIFKKIIVALIILGMLSSLAGCGLFGSIFEPTLTESEYEKMEQAELSDELYGMWYTIAGEDDHYIIISENGYITIVNEPDTEELDYYVLSETLISALVDGTEAYEFEYSDGLLVRSVNGEKDGYTYSKQKPNGFEKDESSKESSGQTSSVAKPSSSNSTTSKPSNTTGNNNKNNTSSVVSSAPATKPSSSVAQPSSSQQATSSQAADISYSITHLEDGIQAWCNYVNYGTGCDLSDGWVYPEALEYLNESQAEWASSMSAVSCCSSISESKEHTCDYIDSSLCVDFNSENFIEYRDYLYVLEGAKGYISYNTDLDESNITRVSSNQLYVITECYHSGGEFANNTRIDFEYKDGAYKVVKVTDIL